MSIAIFRNCSSFKVIVKSSHKSANFIRKVFNYLIAQGIGKSSRGKGGPNTNRKFGLSCTGISRTAQPLLNPR